MFSKSKFIKLLGSAGGYSIARLICKYEPRILMYHRFSSLPKKGSTSLSYFEAQVKYIKENYNPQTLSNLLESINSKGRFPKNAIVITVDDGYEDFYAHGYPVLKKYGVPATLFVTTGFIDGEVWLWPDKVSYIVNEVEYFTDKVILNGVSLDLRNSTGCVTKNSAWKCFNSYLLSISDQAKHKAIVELALQFNVSLPEMAPDEYLPLSWQQLENLQSDGIEIGGHTRTHPSLGRVTEEQAYAEIYGCLEDLNLRLGAAPRTFCYPNGQPQDFQDFLPSMVRRAGFLGAVTAFPDAKGLSDRFLMRRHVGGDDMFQFFKAVSGLQYIGHKLRNDIYL